MTRDADLAGLANTLSKLEKWSEAEAVLRECLAIRDKAQPDDRSRFQTMSLLGGVLMGQGRYAEAEPLLVRGFEGLKQRAAKLPAGDKARLPQAEFYRRMASAWLTWSPAGFGWDCHRHYEAAQCLTVPLINYPTIVRYAPLEDGKHAIYYAPEPGGLTRAVLAALSNRDRLRDVAIAAREHVLAHHTHRARCDAVLEAVFGRP